MHWKEGMKALIRASDVFCLRSFELRISSVAREYRADTNGYQSRELYHEDFAKRHALLRVSISHHTSDVMLAALRDWRVAAAFDNLDKKE